MEEDKYKREHSHNSGNISQEKYHQLKDEIEHLDNLLREKELKILKLEEQNNKIFMNSQNNDESRLLNYEENLGKHSRNYDRNEERVLEERMIEIETIIHRLESTIFSFLSKRTQNISKMNNFDSIGSTHGTFPDALKDFGNRLKKIEGELDKIISTSL